jgi:hypothetical protein
MATAAVSIAPVLTPQTLGVLADTLERADRPEQALSLRSLQPFVQAVVERYFLPLTARRGRFSNRFKRLASEFEPVRLYLNFRLLSAFGSPEFLNFYQQTLRDLLGDLLRVAREMDMGPELISAAVNDYMKIVQAVAQPIDAPSPPAAEMTIEQFTAIVDWIRTATQLDYALTAIFLVLERAVPEPVLGDKVVLLSSCKNAVVEFGQATSKVVTHEGLQRAVENLETPKVTIGLGPQAVSSVRADEASRKSLLGHSPRHIEVNWLKRNKQVSEHYGGQWIVLEKDEMVAHDEDYKKAREAATRRGIKRPFIIFVPRKESGGFMGI